MRVRLGTPVFAGVVQQQNAAVPRPRQRCDSVHPLHCCPCGVVPDNMPASHAGDHRSEAGQGRHVPARGSRGIADPPDSESGSLGRASRLAPTSLDAPKALSAMRLLGKQASLVQFRVGATLLIIRQHRSRASAQAGFISPLCPGQHWRLRPFSLLAAARGLSL